MSVQKRKCEKGLEHTGRWIQAVCLQPTCKDDRLLCFYCIHESHQNHSIAYLIPGLKSPLEVLNKNSQVANSQRHMKYIEKRFTRMNNGWLAISDHLQRGITRIEDRMLPQFNVIRETFKKNSVEQIVGQLTSNEISSQKIQEYVDMINMVKEYKFNDINKLKFMAFLIQHKLSRIFVNANNKIKQIMNKVIEETNETNFLNFNAEELAKDRQLYLKISKNMSFYRVTDLQINTLNWAVLIENNILQEKKSPNKREISKNDKNIDGNSFEEIQIERQSDKNEIPSKYPDLIELIEQQVYPNEQEDKQENISDQFPMDLQHGSIIIVDQNHADNINQSNDTFKEEQKSSRKFDVEQDLPKQISKKENDNENRSISEVSCQSDDHSNGFRSYDKAIQKRQIKQMSMKQWTIIKQENQQKNSINQKALQSNQKKTFLKQGNIHFNSFQKDEEKKEPLQNRFICENKVSITEEQNRTNSMHSEISHRYEDELEFYEQCNRFFEDEEYHYNSESQENQQYQKQEQLNRQEKKSIQSNHMSQVSRKNQQSQLNDKVQDNQACHHLNLQNYHQKQNEQIKMNDDFSKDSNPQQINLDKSDLKDHSYFQCQFSYTQQNLQKNFTVVNSVESQQIRPSYQFSIYISRTQMTLQSSIDLNKNTEFQQNSCSQQKVEIFDENNQFEDLFGLKSQQQDPEKRKRYEVLKKYLIFYNQQNQEQSSEQPVPLAPKRVKWLDEHKKTKLRAGEKQLRKQVKLSQPIQPQVSNFHPRTRSQKLKMIKMLEQSKNKQKSEISKKSYMDQKRENERSHKLDNQIFVNEEEKYDHEQDIQEKKQCSVKEIPIIQLSESIQAQQQSKEPHSQEENDDDKQNFSLSQNQNESHKRSEKQYRQLIQHFQNKEENHGKTSMPILHPLCPSSTRNMISSDIQTLRQQRYCYIPDSPFAFMRKSELFSDTRDGFQMIKEEKKIKMQKVSLKGRFHDDIKQQLNVIDQEFIEELIIYCDTMECAVNEQSVSIICKMTKLKKLCIYWTYKLSKVLTKKIIASLPLLEQLVLCELQDIDTEIANDIVHKLPNLRRFHYASDYMKNLDKMEQNLEFLIDFVGTSTKLAPLFTLSKLKNLETFWVSDIEDVKQVREILYNMKNLKQVSISAFQKRNKDLNTIFTALSKKKSLISLSLQGLQFKQDNLVTVIRSNPDLNTIIINECPTITNNTISAIAETCKNLVQLFLMLTDSLEGERIFELKKLRTLVVRACWSINAPKFREGIKKLQNLQYLSLNMNNYWLGDDMLPSIGTLSNLIFLNLDTTKVTDKGMQHLVGLRNLQTLVCGRTQITANGLYKFLEKTKSKIRKLGLSRQSNEELNRPEKINKHDVIYTEFEGHYLIKIGQLIPQLTHLSIGGFRNLLIEHFATLDNLKCLEYKLQSLPQETQKFLENTRLNLNANF